MKVKVSLLLMLCSFGMPHAAGAQWLQSVISQPLDYGTVNCLSSNGPAIYAGYGSVVSPSFGGIIVSIDEGETWSDFDSGAIGSSVFTIAAQGPVIFAGTGAVFYTVGTSDTMGLSRSLDSGRTWKKLSLKAGYGDLFSLALDGSNLYATTGEGLLLSSDSGIHWHVLTDSSYGPIVFLGEKMFAGSRFQGIVVSSDRGVTWSPCSLSKGTGSNQIVAVGSDLLAVTGSSNVYDLSQYIAFSTDSGRTWTESLIGAPVDQTLIAVALYWKRVFGVAGTSVGASWYSNDLGKTWSSMTDHPDGFGSPNLASSLIIAGDNLVAGTQQQGIEYFPLSSLAVSFPDVAEPSISVSPNPTTRIIYIRDPLGDIAEISIMNILGERVMEMSNLQGSDASIDLSKLSPGVYYAQIVTQGSTTTRMIVRE